MDGNNIVVPVISAFCICCWLSYHKLWKGKSFNKCILNLVDNQMLVIEIFLKVNMYKLSNATHTSNVLLLNSLCSSTISTTFVTLLNLSKKRKNTS